MSDQPQLSESALKTLKKHCSDYEPGISGGGGLKSFPGYTDDDIRAAYKELECADRCGLLEVMPQVPSGRRQTMCSHPMVNGGVLSSTAVTPTTVS